MILTILTSSAMYNQPRQQEYLNGEESPSRPVIIVSPGAMLFLGLLFLVEISLAIFALVLAWKCGKRHQDRFIHVVFALFFPMFYILYYFISGCGSFEGCPAK